MKKWDKIIIAILLVLSFLPYVFFKSFAIGDYNNTYAEITIGGKLYKKIPLTGHKGKTEYVIETPYGNNVVLVEDETIAVIDADCPDKICIEPGKVHKHGSSLVCLPHKLYIEVRGELQEDSEIDARPY